MISMLCPSSPSAATSSSREAVKKSIPTASAIASCSEIRRHGVAKSIVLPSYCSTLVVPSVRSATLSAISSVNFATSQ